MVTPQQFWRLHPSEVWWIIEAITPEKTYGGMQETEAKRLYEKQFGRIWDDD